MLELYPTELEEQIKKPSCPTITAVKYNFCGSELVASYNDEEIHLFNANTGEHIRSYGGHRNSQTVKGVNFYGKRSEYIISGSDCGHLFVWRTANGQLVNYQVRGVFVESD